MSSNHEEALCVRVLWGERRLATHVLHRGQRLALGATGEPVEAHRSPLQFEAGAQHFALGFAEGVTGLLLRNGETPLSLSEAVHRGLAGEAPRGWTFEIGRADVLRLGSGPVTVEAFRVRAPPAARAPLGERVDYRFLNSLLICLALFMVGAMSAQLNEGLDDDDSVSGDVTRMRRILVQTQKPPPKKRSTEATTPETRRTPQKRSAEGSPRPPAKPVRDPGGATAAQLVRTLFGAPGTSGVVGPGGLGRELEGALGSVVAVNGNGLGGWSLRGNGAGGPGGDPAQLGAIGLSGVIGRKNVGALCAGPGPCKASPPLPPPEGPPFSCATSEGGCMDKELIRKVINGHRDQIRYCYEFALQQAPALAGKVLVQFVVAGSGVVAEARVAHTTAGSETLSACLVSRVRTWQFPPVQAGGAGYRVMYPFVFKPSGE